jgi:hypothetical protein
MVYLPMTHAVSVHLTSLRGSSVRGWWYDPRTGQLSHIGKVAKSADPVIFTPPFDGPDWVLVVEDADQFALPPGVIE